MYLLIKYLFASSDTGFHLSPTLKPHVLPSIVSILHLFRVMMVLPFDVVTTVVHFVNIVSHTPQPFTLPLCFNWLSGQHFYQLSVQVSLGKMQANCLKSLKKPSICLPSKTPLSLVTANTLN